MSLERRIGQMRSEQSGQVSPYPLIEKALQGDREALFAYFKQNRSTQALDEELVDVYELRSTKPPTLTLPDDLSFIAGFSMVVSTWYPAIRIVSTVDFKPGDEQIFDEEFGRRFRDRFVTARTLREALASDPSGSTLLEEMARAEFREENLELIGALKAITGIRKMYQALTAE